MAEVRYFNEQGRIRWGEWLNQLREQPSAEFPVDLITNPELTLRAPGGVEIATRVFQSKLELAQNLAPVVNRIQLARLGADKWPGLWDWLAAFYFDSICPAINGVRKPLAISHYKFDPDWKRKYRHRIYGPVGLFKRLGPPSKIIIHGRPSTHTDWEENASSRYAISSNPGIAEALCSLYWDERRSAPKVGVAPNYMKPGTLRRFSVLMLQLDRTYDLLSIDAEGILSLLPREFDQFRSAA